MHLSPIAPGSGNRVKVRWKLSYRIGGGGGGGGGGSGTAGTIGMAPNPAGELRQEEGEVPSLGVA